MKTITIDQHSCLIDECESAKAIIIECLFEDSVKTLEEELTLAREMTQTPFIYIGVLVQDWDDELSPWHTPMAYGNESFSGNGMITKEWLMNSLIPYLRNTYGDHQDYYLVGYSLAALFALWCGYEEEGFKGIGSASPSVWFAGWADYMKQNFKCDKIYLSLGNKEHKTRNQTLRKVKQMIEAQYQVLQAQDKNCQLEMNSGNHFQNVPERMAKAISWLLNDENMSQL